MFDNVNIQTNTSANIIEITNNDMESYIKKAENLVELSMQSSNKAGAFVEQSKTVLNECKKLFGEIEDEIESLGDIHPTRTDNPHSVTAEQVGAYSKEEIDAKSFLTTIPEEYITQTELENKSYLTSSDITDLATKTELVNGLELKQSKLTAGNNIKIENDIVSTSFDVANTDLSNLSEQGTKVLDGQWVASELNLMTKSSGTGDLDLSDYLPNDNCVYEVLFDYLLQAIGTDGQHIYISSDKIASSMEIGYLSTQTTTTSSGIFILPVGASRKITLTGKATKTIDVNAYRRVGTNQ